MGQTEEAIIDIMNWSTKPVIYLSGAVALLGLQTLYFGIRGDFIGATLSVLYLGSAALLVWYSKLGAKFVESESKAQLGNAMVALSSYLSLYLISLPLNFLKASEILSQTQTNWVTWVATFSIVLLLTFLCLRYETRANYRNADFTKHIDTFARINKNKTFLMGVTSLFFGLALFVLIWFGEEILSHPMHWPNKVGTGLNLLVSGTALTFFWRQVREIHRNPSPIYFERTVNGLGFYWLIAPVGTLVQFVFGLF